MKKFVIFWNRNGSGYFWSSLGSEESLVSAEYLYDGTHAYQAVASFNDEETCHRVFLQKYAMAFGRVH